MHGEKGWGFSHLKAIIDVVFIQMCTSCCLVGPLTSMASLGSQDRASRHNETLSTGPQPPKKDLSDRKVASISDLAGTENQETQIQ